MEISFYVCMSIALLYERQRLSTFLLSLAQLPGLDRRHSQPEHHTYRRQEITFLSRLLLDLAKTWE